jgi:hypothetical protein
VGQLRVSCESVASQLWVSCESVASQLRVRARRRPPPARVCVCVRARVCVSGVSLGLVMPSFFPGEGSPDSSGCAKIPLRKVSFRSEKWENLRFSHFLPKQPASARRLTLLLLHHHHAALLLHHAALVVRQLCVSCEPVASQLRVSCESVVSQLRVSRESVAEPLVRTWCVCVCWC